MGVYINHDKLEKEEFLAQNAEELPGRPTWPPPEGKYFVFLVQNAMFSAAGIAYDQREFDSWCDPRDTRPTVHYIIDKEKALPWVGKADKKFLENLPT